MYILNSNLFLMSIAAIIDHTLLKPTISLQEVKTLCNEAIEYGFAAVCNPPPFVRNARAFLGSSPVKTCTVIGFPFGYSIARAKVFEAAQALDDGADELDMAINIAALKNGQWQYLESEVKYILEAVHKREKILKVIIESGVLTDQEIIRCCSLYANAGVDFLKTSTGYAEKGADTHAVALMRSHLPEQVRIKASGGIKTYETARAMVGAGADRLGCSAGIAIVKDEPQP